MKSTKLPTKLLHEKAQYEVAAHLPVQSLGRREALKDKGTLCNQAAGFRDSRPESVGTPGEPADLELADEFR